MHSKSLRPVATHGVSEDGNVSGIRGGAVDESPRNVVALNATQEWLANAVIRDEAPVLD